MRPTGPVSWHSRVSSQEEMASPAPRARGGAAGDSGQWLSTWPLLAMAFRVSHACLRGRKRVSAGDQLAGTERVAPACPAAQHTGRLGEGQAQAACRLPAGGLWPLTVAPRGCCCGLSPCSERRHCSLLSLSRQNLIPETPSRAASPVCVHMLTGAPSQGQPVVAAVTSAAGTPPTAPPHSRPCSS